MKNFLFLCVGLVIGFKAKDWMSESQKKSDEENLVSKIDEKIAQLDTLVKS